MSRSPGAQRFKATMRARWPALLALLHVGRPCQRIPQEHEPGMQSFRRGVGTHLPKLSKPFTEAQVTEAVEEATPQGVWSASGRLLLFG